jgi:hypothetical protein
VRVDRNRKTIEGHDICCKLQAEISGAAENRHGSPDFLESIVHVSGDLQAVSAECQSGAG